MNWNSKGVLRTSLLVQPSIHSLNESVKNIKIEELRTYRSVRYSGARFSEYRLDSIQERSSNEYSILLPSLTRKNIFNLLMPEEIHKGGSEAVTTASLPTPATRTSSRCWDSINTILTYVEILLNISKSFKILLNISEQYWTRIIISSHNFNKLKDITNK